MLKGHSVRIGVVISLVLLVTFSSSPTPIFADSNDPGNIISKFIDDFWGVLTILWELDTIKNVFEEYKNYNKSWHQNFVLPNASLLDSFSDKVNSLDTTVKYCDFIDVIPMIKAYDPWEKLDEYCDIPEGLSSSMAQNLVN